jgi:hypothetical protein
LCASDLMRAVRSCVWSVQQTDKSQYAHPMDEYFRTLFANLKSVGDCPAPFCFSACAEAYAACGCTQVGTRYGKVSEEELRTENLRLAEELAKKQALIDKLTTM